jgi:hypothetical protein
MRKTILASVILVLGGVAMSSASCGSGSTGTDGGAGSAGSGGKGGTAGKGGSSGSGGTTGSGTGGSSGAGGSTGSGGPCTGEDAAAAGLGLPGSCETCVGKNCCADFQTCFGDPGCKATIDCVVDCYHKGGTLETCAETTCATTSDSSASQAEANKLEFCLVDNCATPGICIPAKDGGGEAGGD